MKQQVPHAKRTRRRFTAEFKAEAVDRLQARRAAGVPVTQIARELDVSAEMLRSWGRQLEQREGDTPLTEVFPGQGRLASAPEELRRLQRENQRLQQENSFLKAAAAYFAKTSR
jgi:transposase